MPRHPSFHHKLQELVVDERLSDSSSPEIQREIEAYERIKKYGGGTTKELGRMAIEWEDAEIKDSSQESN